MKQLFSIIIVTTYLSCCNKPQILETRSIGEPCPWTDSSASHPKNAVFTGLINKYRTKGLPGISLLVNDQSGTWIGSTGKADIENNIEFVPGTVSKAASITKLFMSTLVFRLMEDSAQTGLGFNALGNKLSAWLSSDLLSKLPNGKLITLRQCMNHETGVPDIIEQNAFYLAVLNDPNRKWQPEELLEYVYGKDPLFAPSDTAIYSNTNTILIKLVIEAATKRSHADLLKQYILRPLHLEHTFYQPYDQLPNSTAQGYFDLYNDHSIINVSNLVTGSGNGYGGLYSNVFDLFTFIQALFIDKTLLSSKSLALMQTYGKQDDTNYYGLGIEKSFLDRGNDFGIGHKGRDLGYTANLFYFPASGITHVFFVNYGTDADSDLKDVFREFQEELVKVTLQ